MHRQFAVCLVLLCASGCSFLEHGPDQVPLVSHPAGATVRLHGGGRTRTLPGVTPMTIGLDRNLADPLEIEFFLDGHAPARHLLQMVQSRGLKILDRDEWRWPTDPIEISLIEEYGFR